MSQLGSLRDTFREFYHKDEETVVQYLLDQYHVNPALKTDIYKYSQDLILKSREKIKKAKLADAMLYKYKLSSKEGLALMCLAEALLRIPDSKTANELIEDRLAGADWGQFLSSDSSMLLNASSFALNLTGKILNEKEGKGGIGKTLKSLFKKTSEPVIQQAIRQSMGLLSQKFVVGETIEKALKNAQSDEKMGYLHSYDMLGEAAFTEKDAITYFESYRSAIEAIGKASKGRGERDGPGISIKLSALHPRYEHAQRDRVLKELVERLMSLALLAKSHNIGMTIDAEESYRLDLSLEVLELLLSNPDIAEWNGLGFVVQAYQKRSARLIDWLEGLARSKNTRIRIRLVKGAYWDSEIKLGQVDGVEDFPVFTQKSSTDLSYLVCAQKLLRSEAFYPMFATHNAQTIGAVYHMAKGKDYEFQKLFGMGNELYSSVIEESDDHIKCRIYAPVGTHKDLLPYLVRRLLENGANTSFVNHIADTSIHVDDLTLDPYDKVVANSTRRHPQIPLPADIYGPTRVNSKGVNLSDPQQLEGIEKAVMKKGKWASKLGTKKPGEIVASMNPFNGDKVGTVELANEIHAQECVDVATKAFPDWSNTPVETRADHLDKTADLMEQNRDELLSLCAHEAGKTIPDAISEVREAVDFCRYYAQQARAKLADPIPLPGPSGEENSLSLQGRGPFVCISPWNFPLAIFMGQVSAALVAGNSVLAKPAGETPLIASYATSLLHKAGVPEEVMHLVPGKGSTVGSALVQHSNIAGVTLTGSTETAWHINKVLADKRGPIVPFIAETGGQNTMIVDSSALPEQVVQDVISSSFRSSGQRCSALRVLFVQEEISVHILDLLAGAMQELKLGDPRLISTDVGPVISRNAMKDLNAHKNDMKKRARLIYESHLPVDCKAGCFVTPAAYEIESLDMLTKENFGPILHVIKYEKDHLDKVLSAINGTGYGLTQGLHTRVQSKANKLHKSLHAGNMYVNRNMIGAVVGAQPFGGEGLSGTGPKAGGPHYLYRFVSERTLSVDTTAQGGNTQLLTLEDL